MENKSKFIMLDDGYLDTAIQIVREMKSLGLVIPKEELLYTDQFMKIEDELKQLVKYLPKNISVNKIEICDRLKRNKETFYLIKKYFGKSIESTGRLYEKHVVKEDSRFEKSQTEMYYQRYNDFIIPTNITIAQTENSIQSVILASSLIETIKNKSLKEFSELWKEGKTIPIFLNLLFASELSKKENNADLKYAIDIFQLWMAEANLECFEEIKKGRNDQISSYLGKVAMTMSVYPYLNGYANALKLEYLYKKDPKYVLKQIKYVIENLETTASLLETLKIEQISYDKVFEEKAKELKLK